MKTDNATENQPETPLVRNHVLRITLQRRLEKLKKEIQTCQTLGKAAPLETMQEYLKAARRLKELS